MKLTKAEKEWILGEINGTRSGCFLLLEYKKFMESDWNEDHYAGIPHSEFLIIKSIWKKAKK